jgi:hypothetical protein
VSTAETTNDTTHLIMNIPNLGDHIKLQSTADRSDNQRTGGVCNDSGIRGVGTPTATAYQQYLAPGAC